MTLRPYRTSAIVLLTLHLSACGPWLTETWQPTTLSPKQLIEEQHPVMINLTKNDGSQLVLVYPTVEGDSISGSPPEACELGAGCHGVRVKLALADVTAVETSAQDSEMAEALEPREPEGPPGLAGQVLTLVFLVGVLGYAVLDFLCSDGDACYGAGF